MKYFLFYDIETTGLNTAFDQILVFAAIKTDINLNEIERYNVVIKLREDIIPSPGAFITHRLLPKDWSEGVCEYEASLKIHSILNSPDTVSIGYNNLGFDDEFLRFTFYRNLLNPYSHQYLKGCYRMDMLPITTLYKVVKPEILKWPTTYDGSLSLKLELISRENKFITSGKSHNAMADVEATIELAKLLIKEEKIWRYCIDLFDKNSEKVKIDRMLSNISQRDYPIAVMVLHRLGADLNYIAPVIGIGRSYHYANQSLWLRLDTNYISGESSYIIRKKDGEIGIILPNVERFWDRLSDNQKNLASQNLAVINADNEKTAIFNDIAEFHRQFKYPLVPEADLDSSLYQSPFFTNLEKEKMNQFHKSSLIEKMDMIEKMEPSRIRELAIRIMFRNYLTKNSELSIKDYNLLDKINISNLISQEYNTYMQRTVCNINDPDFDTKKIVGFKRDERLVPQKALEDLNNILRNNQLDEEQKNVLKWLESYLCSICH